MTTINTTREFGRTEELVITGLISHRSDEIGYIPSLPTVSIVTPEGVEALVLKIEPSFSKLKIDSDLKDVSLSF